MSVANKIDLKNRRQQIIDAASELFSSKGYYGTRMTDIARHIGVTKPVVYRYFDSKEILFDEWFDEVISKKYDELIYYIINSSDDARKVTKKILDIYSEMVVDPLVLAPYRIALMEAGVCPEITKIVYDKMQARFVHAVNNLFERSIENKTIKGANALVLTHLFIAPVCANLLQHTVFGYQPVHPDRLREFYDAHYYSFWQVWGA